MSEYAPPGMYESEYVPPGMYEYEYAPVCMQSVRIRSSKYLRIRIRSSRNVRIWIRSFVYVWFSNWNFNTNRKVLDLSKIICYMNPYGNNQMNCQKDTILWIFMTVFTCVY
jgi:hypothetical protein